MSYNVDEIYHYATSATYQLSGGSPPPPAPPSPPLHGQIHSQVHPTRREYPYDQNYQKGFTTVVYQSASLHDVDGSNQVSFGFLLSYQ